MILPEVINNFNVYDGKSNKMIGVSGEVTLSEIAAVTAALSGAGLIGEMNVPVVGQVGSMEQEVPFNVLNGNVFSYFTFNKPAAVILRGSIQNVDTSTGEIKHTALKVSYNGYTKKINPGKVKGGDTMGASVTLELTYIHIELAGKTVIKIDKLNSVFIVDGVDLLADIKRNC